MLPTYAVKITFATEVTITGVQSIEIEQGREDAFDRIEAGSCRLVLENADGRFSPENTGSPYNGYVKPMRLVKVEATFNAVTYGLFYGYVQRWTPIPEAGSERVVVECVDPFIKLQGQKLTNALALAATGTRIGDVLDAASWSGALRDLDVGISNRPAYTLATETALTHIQDVVEAEDGLCWAEGDGDITFRDRHARYLDTVSTVSQATFGGASGLGFTSFEYDYAVDQVYNDVRITRTGGVEQTASDATSQTDYGVRTFTRSSDHYTSDNETLAFAQWFASKRKDPQPRLHSITLEGGNWDALWTQMFARKINDRITVVREFPGALGLNRDFWIEGIRHSIADGLNSHQVQWLLSAANVTSFFVLDTSTLDGAHVLGY